MAAVRVFECPVCLNDYVDPVTAPCGHSLCRACYVGWLAQARGGTPPSCPTCRDPLPHEPPHVNITIRDAQAAVAQLRVPPALAAMAEADLTIDASPTGLLGRGSFGEVRRASWRGTPVAVKSLQRDASEVGEAPARELEKEMQVLARLRHPNVVPLFGLCRHADGRLSLVQELEAGGSLFGRLHPAVRGGAGGAASASAHMGLGEIAKVGLDVARALCAAHAAGVAHCDVKSGNVLFSAAGAAVLADFGSAKRVRSAMPNTLAAVMSTVGGAAAGGLLGTPNWTAPENLNEEGALYGQPPGDVYSFGMLLYEMLVLGSQGGPPLLGGLACFLDL